MPTGVENVKLGACNVTYGTTDLGLTKGGVSVAISTEKKSVTVDQFGQTIMNDYIMSKAGTVTVPMAEHDLVKLAAVTPGATLVTDKTVATKKKLLINTGVGTSLLSIAKELVLHPTNLPAGDKSEDVVVPLATPNGSISFAYNAENERIYNVEFTMYPDAATGLLCIMGDKTASAI